MSDDPHDLMRFLIAQDDSYEEALAEIRDGQKQSHWMWYIFPRFDWPGASEVGRRYSIKSLDEAVAYLAHLILGQRLIAISEAAIAIKGKSADAVFGEIDAWKLHGCATLFARISQEGSVFHRLLDNYFGGLPAKETLELLGALKDK